MNGFSAADMSTAAANWFRDGLAAQNDAAQAEVERAQANLDAGWYARREQHARSIGYSGVADALEALEAASTPAAPGIDLRNAILQLREDALHMKDPGDTVNAYNRVLALIDASPKGGSDALTIPEPHLECYSNNDGDSWYEHPADYELVQGLKVGDTYTLDVSHYSVERTYRVTKAPDETSDDYEVEPVQATSAEVGE